jgi:hypothetical protein
MRVLHRHMQDPLGGWSATNTACMQVCVSLDSAPLPVPRGLEFLFYNPCFYAITIIQRFENRKLFLISLYATLCDIALWRNIVN